MKLRIKILLFLVFGLIQANATTGTGKIAGKVIDKKTAEELIGVTVIVEGTSFGAATDFEGNFIIGNLKPGNYNLILSYVSYEKKILKGVEVKAGEVTNVNISIEASQKQLNEVVVQAEMRRENASALLLTQKKSTSISDGVSADMIKKTPDATTGDVMKRVSGTSIQDNKFAVIRGLNDRYNTAYINGAPLPSSESDRKAFSFDIIPSNMLDNMVINKSATPDLPGDFAGGLITINTKDIPEKKFTSVSVGGSYHSISTFKEGNTYNGGNTDWLGVDDGTRLVPSDIPERGAYNSQSLEDKVNSSKKFNSDWKTQSLSALPINYSLQLSGGNSYKVGKKDEFGFIVSASYSNSNKNSYVERNQFNRPMDAIDNQIVRSYQDTITKSETLMGIMVNFGYKIGTKSKISFKNAYTINGEDQTILRSGNDDYTSEQMPLVRNTYYNFSQSKLLTSQLTGEHFLSGVKTKVKWVLNNNVIDRQVPDFRRYSTFSTMMDASTGQYTPYAAKITSSNPDITQTGRFYSSLNEVIRSAGLDLQKPLDFATTKHLKTEAKVGAFIQGRSRDFEARAFAPVLKLSGLARNKFLEGSLDTMFAEGNYSNNFYFDEDFRAQDEYTASSSLKAGYLMLDQRVYSRLRLVYGVRFESYNQTLNSFELNSNPPLPLSVDTIFNDWLPSLNATYELTEKVNIRASAFKSVARPEFREIAPFAFFDFNLNTVVTGKPTLTRTRINNYDLRFEYYPGESQLISASLFYKEFINPIENVYEFIGSDATQGYSSDAKATNYGIELELRKNFGFVDGWVGSKWMHNLTFTCNYAYIVSEVKLDESVSLSKYGSRPLQGQSPYILNTSLQYYEPKSGLSLALFANKIGRRIAYVRAKNGEVPDLWENPRTVLDFSISKRIVKGLEAKFSINDLLAQDLVFYQDNNGNGKLDTFNKEILINNATSNSAQRLDMDNVMFKYKMGYTVSFSLSYKF
ncbi:MAG: TonB-dependent receptor [Bacteroidia bacterium]|nr:TonB-dependent receptor [Bacteroidia bacterium]